MAALPSRPSLRSSSRHTTVLYEVPPTHAVQKTPANSRRGKHTRESSLGGQSNISVKRLKLGLPDPTRSKDGTKAFTPRSLPIRDRSEGQDAIQAHKPDPLQRINGTTTATQNGKPVHNTAALTVNTKDVSNESDKRSLRSHDGCSRSKSELALYFPNYDELVSIEPKEPGRTLNDPYPYDGDSTDPCY